MSEHEGTKVSGTIVGADGHRKAGIVDATIGVAGGSYFDLLNPNHRMVDIQDIAASLSKLCRFNGHLKLGMDDIFSVAQHSVEVSLRVAAVDESLAFPALMHDSPEYVLGDMTGPLKQLCPDYKAHEKRITPHVLKRFLLTPAMCEEAAVKVADLRSLCTDKRDITAFRGHDWNGLDERFPAYADQRTICWTPNKARRAFLARFAWLWRKWLEDHHDREEWIVDNGLGDAYPHPVIAQMRSPLAAKCT